MKNTSSLLPNESKSLWLAKESTPTFSSLEEDLNVDVVIVGGGITGINTAYLLSQENLSIALIDSGKLCSGTTGHTTAKLTAQHGLIYNDLINSFSEKEARLYYEAQSDAMSTYERLIKEMNIDCDLEKKDAYIFSDTGENADKIVEESQAYEKLNIKGQLVNELPFNLSVENALIMENQAQFHPLKYLNHLIREISDQGVKIFEDTTAVKIDTDSPRPIVHTRNKQRITAAKVIIASHFPFYEGIGLYSAKMHAERSYVIAAKSKLNKIDGMHLGIDSATRSVRLTKYNGEDILLIGGESHKAGKETETMKRYKLLEKFGKEVFGIEEILFRWSTQDLVTVDKLPYIGPLTSNTNDVLVATGFRKWGMTNSLVAAKVMKNTITGDVNPYEGLFTPARWKDHPRVREFAMEAGSMATEFIKGKLDHPRDHISGLEPDQGIHVEIDGQRKGAYKDTNGEVFIVDTTCTHAGCEVNWNEAERTWDCPCHGSRFTYKGEVFEGPAEKPLKTHDYKALDNLTSDESGY
ncbi:FAD-dependent oxidoreductase [Halalkalibacillus sediminis]|uniref:FAD-dependent oxidoreductase n=1 Tax=Halalkalibacillus sediminis TaxID=2018042 RepID=A0A2I0QRC6_9BACI|nr:FAD-dependent oxidoreductase [Halalkalibacillus sediminis]PKR76887.1 FAD-dependent oxidoreductase [Halalkalibacillus sediminis]